VMSLPVLVAFAGVLVAAVATGLLAGRCVREPRAFFILWTVGTLGLTIALAAQATGLATGFQPATFRIVQLGAQLIAPLWLGWGLVELAAGNEAARFGARLVSGALTLVAGLILVADPLSGQSFGKTWPSAGVHYQTVPHFTFDVVHVVALLGGAYAVSAVAARGRRSPPWRAALPGVAAVGVALVLTVALRFSRRE